MKIAKINTSQMEAPPPPPQKKKNTLNLVLTINKHLKVLVWICEVWDWIIAPLSFCIVLCMLYWRTMSWRPGSMMVQTNRQP